MRQALSDLRIVELGHGVAAAWCGKVFADLGADVVKVEAPEGDVLRADRGVFAHLHTNKRSVVLESAPSAAGALGELLEDVDLVIEAPGQGALKDWGIERDDLLVRQSTTSIVAITGWGVNGPYADYAWSDLVAQAYARTLLLSPHGPVRLPMSVEECAIGHTAAEGALAAVLRARASGVGALVDCAAVEVLAANPTRIALHLGWEYREREDVLDQIRDGSTTLLPLGIHPCGDGYVSMMMTVQQLPEMLRTLGDPELTEWFGRPDVFTHPETKEKLDSVLYPWLFGHTRQEITDAAQAQGWPVTPVLVPEDELVADHLYQRGFWVSADDPELGRVLLPGAPYRLAEGGWTLRRPAPSLGDSSSPSNGSGDVAPKGPPAVAKDPRVPPLTGLRVLDITTVWSGPLLTLHLADLGAEVIRLESPYIFPPTTRGLSPRPDSQMLLSALVGGYRSEALDGDPDRPYNRHSMYNSINRGKLSCTLDVRFEEQRELFFQLVKKSDVFVENLKMSTLHQLGIHESELLKANPEMIVLRLPPAGLVGDWAHYTGFGGQFDGLNSLGSLCGHRGTELFDTPSTQHMDSVTGPAGVFALLAALHYRAATGRGQLVELSQSENVLAQLGEVFVDLQLGEAPQRYGNRHKRLAPQGLYPCADGRLLALTVNDDQAWQALSGVIGRDDLAQDEGLRKVRGRQGAHDEIDEAIAAWTSTLDALDAFHQLQAAGVAAAPFLDDRLFVSDPQVIARDWVRPITTRDVGSFNHLGHPFRGIPLAWGKGAPALGEDNEYVFKQILGLDDDEYKHLVDERIAVEDFLDAAGNPY
jgi:crotonobetainyl-CoA:carnitine CoA-transferase CaiB-like acyl-CoA transferase